MKPSLWFGGIVFVGLSGFVVGRLTSQEPKEAGGKMDDLMAMFMKLATPGEHHKHLEPIVGSWTLENRFWMTADAPVQTSTATCERHWILGGRFVEENVKGTWEGQPFDGRGIYGYDNHKKIYHSYWVDTMATACMTSTGTCTADGKTITYEGVFPNPFAGMKDDKFKTTIQIVNNDKHVFTMYLPGADGKVFKHFESTYTRKKEAAR